MTKKKCSCKRKLKGKCMRGGDLSDGEKKLLTAALGIGGIGLLYSTMLPKK